MSTHQGADGSSARFFSDKPFEWRPGRIYIPAWQFAGLGYEATGAANVKSIGTGTPSSTNLITKEINTSGIVGIDMTTTDNTVCHLMEVPADLDVQKPVYTSVYWTANNTSGSVDWEMFYKVFVPNTTVLGTAEAATAMDTVGAAQTITAVAYTVMRTPEMVVNGGKIAESTELLQWTVQMHALATITTATFIGLAIRYSPRRLRGPDGMAKEAKKPISIAAKQYN
jgi:hypothetical protein